MSVAPIQSFPRKNDAIVLSISNLCDIVKGKRVQVKGEDFGVVFMASDDPREDLRPARELVALCKDLQATVEDEASDSGDSDGEEDLDDEEDISEEDLDSDDDEA